MKSQKKISIIVFISTLVLIALFALYRKRNLENNFIVSSGYIYDFGNSRYSGATIFFKFRHSVNGVTYYGNFDFPCVRENKLHFRSWTNGKIVQVVYERNNPNNCKLLLTREDYKEHGLSIPIDYKQQVELIDSICSNN